MRVSILIMAFLPPLRALISASSARDWASLHWASSSLRSFSRDMAMSCSERSSSARRAASIMARAAFSSDSLASLAISSRSALRVLDSFSSFLLAAATAWFWLVRSASVSLVSHSSCSSAAAAVGLLQQGAGLLQGILHGGGLPLGGHLLVLGHRLHLGLVVNLGLGIAHLVLVLLDGALGLEGAGVGVLQSQLQVSHIGLQLLLHAHGLSLALGLGLKSGLHGLQRLGLVLLHA